MNMADYCFEKGMDIGQYECYERNINIIADSIIELIKQNYHIGNGIYHEINEIINPIGDKIQIGFIIQSLKSKGVEFFDNNTLWRY